MKSGWLSLTLVCVSALALNACKVDTPDGKIPEDYIAQAKQMVGNYKGQMDDGQAGVLTFRMNGAAPILKMTGGRLLGADCSSDIGQLLSVEADGSSVSEATFALSGAECVEGNTVSVSVSSDLRTLDVSVLVESHDVTKCPSQWEISECERKADHDLLNCDSETNSSLARMCRDEANRRYGSCSSCSTETVGTWVQGYFERQ